MATWEISEIGLHPGGSNYVFVVKLQPKNATTTSSLAIYKPTIGERPLHDFQYQTLHLREVAAFRLSRWLKWPLIPATVVRNGPYGEGSVQAFIEHDPNKHFFALRDTDLERFIEVAAFDILTNNADRKGGAVVIDAHNNLWAIDHGLTFNYEARIRTVMLEFSGQSLPPNLLQSIERLQCALKNNADIVAQLQPLITAEAIRGLTTRCEEMLTTKCFPELDINRNVPYPFI